MKRALIALTMLMAALLALSALAEGMPGFEFIDPFEDRDGAEPQAEAGNNGIQLDIGGKRLTLDFDPSPEYSSIQNGLVQASFYAYGDDSATLYELYLVFPETVQSGMVISPDYAALTGEECSVALILSENDEETYYYSGLMDGVVYPGGSDFDITFDAISENRYSGTLTATLIALDLASGTVKDTLNITSAPFSFTLDGDSSARHTEPLPTPEPKDLRKV